MPEAPSVRIGCTRPSQAFKSPTTLTERADGAQTVNADAGRAVDGARVGAEPLPQRLVAALAHEVKVELAEVGRKV